ncbi:MAG: hypothetical protein ACQEXV_22605 [Bacillota bacterium]
MKYTCACGESRFFYTEVSVQAKQRIDLKDGPRHGKVYDIEPDNIADTLQDMIYCGKCSIPVDMSVWADYDD